MHPRTIEAFEKPSFVIGEVLIYLRTLAQVIFMFEDTLVPRSLTNHHTIMLNLVGPNVVEKMPYLKPFLKFFFHIHVSKIIYSY